MGNNKSSNRFVLKKTDFKLLSKKTNLPEREIKDIYEKFKTINQNGELNKYEFVELYSKIRPEGHMKLETISQFVFNAFDKGNKYFFEFFFLNFKNYFLLTRQKRCYFV